MPPLKNLIYQGFSAFGGKKTEKKTISHFPPHNKNKKSKMHQKKAIFFATFCPLHPLNPYVERV